MEAAEEQHRTHLRELETRYANLRQTDRDEAARNYQQLQDKHRALVKDQEERHNRALDAEVQKLSDRDAQYTRDLDRANDNFIKSLQALEDIQQQNFAAMKKSQDDLDQRYASQLKTLTMQHQRELDRVKAANEQQVQQLRDQLRQKDKTHLSESQNFADQLLTAAK
jgi:hypothetical protein